MRKHEWIFPAVVALVVVGMLGGLSGLVYLNVVGEARCTAACARLEMLRIPTSNCQCVSPADIHVPKELP